MPAANISKTFSHMVMRFLKDEGMLNLRIRYNFVVMTTNSDVIGKTSKFKNFKNFFFQDYFSHSFKQSEVIMLIVSLNRDVLIFFFQRCYCN